MCGNFDGLGSATRHVFQPLFVHRNRLCYLFGILLYLPIFTKNQRLLAEEGGSGSRSRRRGAFSRNHELIFSSSVVWSWDGSEVIPSASDLQEAVGHHFGLCRTKINSKRSVGCRLVSAHSRRYSPRTESFVPIATRVVIYCLL